MPMVRTPGIDSNGRQLLGVLGAHPMATDDLFRARLDGRIDLRHPLAVLASRMPWPELPHTRNVRDGKPLAMNCKRRPLGAGATPST